MRVVFLDFDGVLHRDTDDVLPEGELSDMDSSPALVSRLSDRCARGAASVVISALNAHFIRTSDA